MPNRSKAILIGITGLIGSGKSTAAKLLAKAAGGIVIDADRIGRSVVEDSPQLLRRLVRQFGPGILNRAHGLNRKRLAALAFTDNISKNALERLIHPYLLRELRRQIAAASKSHPLVIVDAALLLYWKLDSEMNRTLVIHAFRETRLERLALRGISRTDALARERLQLPLSVYRARADHVILNNGSQTQLQAKLILLLRKIVRIRATCR
jgi:dephospho-CoA kinase